MKRLVLDTSVALSWCYPDEASPFGRTVLNALDEARAVVPEIWPLEVANSLVVSERRGRLTPADTARYLDLVRGLPIEVDTQTHARAFAEAMPLARLHGLSAYDAAYLELAMREGLPLATLDAALRRAARKSGVKLLGE